MRVQLVEQTKDLDLKLRMLAAQSQVCQILMSIPGVGIQTSAAFSAAIDEAAGSDNRETRVPNLAWCPGVTNPANSIGPAGSQSKVTAWSASFSMKQPTQS
ncbi:hypothetical protein [Mesorhizobium sp. M1399]|uniref:hypothetical protein n=1 Tax=Mesorhizobium sp. M1399 TaxID=2957096 RepID=UPI0033383424